MFEKFNQIYELQMNEWISAFTKLIPNAKRVITYLIEHLIGFKKYIEIPEIVIIKLKEVKK